MAVLTLALPSRAHAQLSSLGASNLVSTYPVRGTDSAYDPNNHVYFVVGAYGSVGGAFVDESGVLIGSPFSVNAPTGAFAHYPRAIFVQDLNGGAGGFLVTWHQDDGPVQSNGQLANLVHARIVTYPAGPTGADVAVSAGDTIGTWWESGAAIAYSRTSHLFLVVWQSCCGGGSSVRYRQVDLNGQPVGNIVQVSGGYGRDPGVAWNPATDEFGISYDGEDLTSVMSAFARVSGTGVLLRRNVFYRTTLTYITDVAYNPDTGRYVMVWSAPPGGGIRGAEIDAAGDPVATGLISSIVGAYDGLGLSFSPVSRTFLMVGHHATSLNVGAIELNMRGGRSGSEKVISSTNPPPTIGSFYPRPSASTVNPRWNVSYSRDFAAAYVQEVETTTTAGGANVDLGAVPSGTGTTSPPPPPPPTGGCTTPDPFVALGGGTCVNGGWLPPGSTTTTTTTTTPPPPPPPSSTCTTPDPFAAMGGGTCYNGGWLPPGMVPPSGSTTTTTPPPPPPPSSTTCTTPDPFAAMGGGTCYNGGWLPPGIVPPGGSTTTTTTTTGGCTTPDPFTSIGGGTCINGGWVPTSSLPTLCSGLPDPFTAIGGGVCINGGWVPRTALGGGRP